jgi:hypothetical protein
MALTNEEPDGPSGSSIPYLGEVTLGALTLRSTLFVLNEPKPPNRKTTSITTMMPPITPSIEPAPPD